MSVTRAYLVGPALVDPFQPIAGLPLLLRALFTLQEAGIQEVHLRGFTLGDLPGRERLSINIIESEGEPSGPAVVARVGVVWHPNTIKQLVARDAAPDDIIEYNDNASLYLAGASSIGELISSLSDPPEATQTETPAAPEFVALPLTKEDALRIEENLFASLIKPSDGLISRKLNRRISFAVTRLVLGTSLTPNQMTLIAAIFGFVGIAIAWQATFWSVFVGAFFYQMQSVLDGCDGEIARLKYLKSRVGEWLDQVLDDVINIGFLVAAGHYLAIQNHPTYWTFTLIVLALHTLYQLSLYSAFLFKAGGRASVGALRWWGQGQNESSVKDVRPTSLYLWLVYLFENAGKRDFFTFAYLPLALLGHIEIAFVWHAVIAAISGVITSAQWIVSGGPEAVN
jgi:phosphatidylglycerophosphate synthase